MSRSDSHTFLGEARALLRLGGPVIAAQLAQMSMGFVDTVMAGRLSASDLAAVAVGNSLWMTVLIFGWGLLMSVSPTVAHAYGAGEHHAIASPVRQGLWLSLAVAAGSYALLEQLLPVLDWLEIEPGLVPTAIGFVRALAWGLPASTAFTVLRCFSEAVGRTRPIMVVSLVGVVANIVGNYAFMYGQWGLPRLGAVGCGVASAITMWVMTASLAAWIASDPYFRPFQLFAQAERPHVRRLVRLLKLGAPIGVCMFLEVSMFATVSLLMGRLGQATVAGHQIAVNVASVTFMVPLGLSVAITVRVGHAMGRRAPDDARHSGFVGAALAAGFMSLAGLVIAVWPEAIAAIYTNDAAVQRTAVSLLLMAAIFQICDGLQVAAAAALRGLKDTTIPMVITALAYWGLGLPLGYVLGISLARGPQAMWVGLIAGLTAAALLLNARFWLVTHRFIREQRRTAKLPAQSSAASITAGKHPANLTPASPPT